MEKVDIGAVIKYLCKKGISPKEIHEGFLDTLGMESPSYSTEGLKMAESADIVMDISKVIIRNFVALKKYMHPDPLIDCDTGFELLTITDRRNSKGKDITDKNEMILRKVISKGVKGYSDFKERLKKTWQTELLDLLTCAENEQDTTEIESRLKKTAVLSQEYIKHRGELKDCLIVFYKKRHSKIFLSPLFEEKDTPLLPFYIRPELNSIASTQTGNDDKIPVKSLSEMFKSVHKGNREIYVPADAGVGKTAFSKYLANLWCQFNCPDEGMTQYFAEDDLDCMQEFDFLFLVLLRDSYNLCSIDDLIFETIVSNLGFQNEPSKDFLLKILKNEKYLVILDGLDEWTHPKRKCSRMPRSIPHRNDRENCTILTTTRPWKLDVLQLKSSEIGEKVELTKLSKNSADTLTRRILQILKPQVSEDALQKDVTKLKEEINSRKNAELTSVPLLLIFTICLWCDGAKIGNSKCDIYVNLIELLLSRTTRKQRQLKQLDISSSDIPKYFAEYENCMKYYLLLVNLGKLAFYTLLNETKENTLVFAESVAKKYLSTDEMKFTLHSGMLSESTSKTLTKKYSKVSFFHKTVQEFFAAIFISSQSDAQKTVLEKCRNLQDILDMSNIWEFISKLNADRMCAISNDLMTVRNEDEKTRDFRIRTCVEHYIYTIPFYVIQTMFMSCLQEMPESENIQLCLQDFFIDAINEHSELLQRLLKQNKHNIKSLYIDTINTSRKLHELIDLFSLTDLCHIQTLFYEDDEEKEAEINLILFPSLQSVTLRTGKWTNGEETLNENLARCQKLQYLHISSFTLSHKIMETIFNFVYHQKLMKELTLKGLKCKEHVGHECERWNLDVSQHSTLTKLKLRNFPRLHLNITTPSLVNVKLSSINLDESSLILSCDMLNIAHLELKEIDMSAGSLQKITLLENLPQTVTVEMGYIKPFTEYDRIRENIRRSQTFNVIRDDDWLSVVKLEKSSEKTKKEKHCEIS
ncbi:uncharacterized protein LOC132756548 [Ruditapes philippinarum]|uniref:uncharacterized protein LOC132756548 n=1 Tax=Ruditapes philippinarum TaxID=129788 RepID=UPI00295BB4EE|nr:uncharacterized protein LOC132756548 [Ruditapes philippinarum]